MAINIFQNTISIISGEVWKDNSVTLFGMGQKEKETEKADPLKYNYV